ncbi:putative dynein heavy chain [Phakopsora pachyrhizi]|nr:putative dynein heavy chain [Phakopsora pachyrhizi]
MWQGWLNHLNQTSLKYKPELPLAKFLSTADDQLGWQSKSLPPDDLCTENTIMLRRINHYPLVLDPSGQATIFLMNEYKDQKMLVTSFLDEAFVKSLESSLHIVLIQLGNQDINFSPAFTMFLYTREPSVEFSPDIFSRVTFVNFTMTWANLHKHPDTYKKQMDLMKLQALSESTSNILDDDKVIDNLEVKTKVEETEIVMKEVDEVMAEYLPLAQASSSVFFVLEQLHVLNHFYQFSLMVGDTFEQSVYHHIQTKIKGLLHCNHLMFGMLLAQNNIGEQEYKFLLKGGGERSSKYPSVNLDFLLQDQVIRVQSFQKLSCLKEVVSNLESESEAWKAFLKSTWPENAIQKVWSTKSIENLVTSTNSPCASIAMGSQEGYGLAYQAISTAIQTGSWVFLKNVHLASNWLTLNPPKTFRLFLTMETNTGISVNVLHQSQILMNEPLPGIRVNLVDCLKSILPAPLFSGPNEKARLYFLFAWFHAVFQEQLRYCPLSWSNIYEFNDLDLEAAMSMIDSWIIATAKGKSNIDPAQIPWAAMRVLLKQAVYGGRVNSDWDQKLLDSFVDTLFCPASFEVGYHLFQPVEDKKGFLIAEGERLEHFVFWTQALPERKPPH